MTRQPHHELLPIGAQFHAGLIDRPGGGSRLWARQRSLADRRTDNRA